MHTIVHTRFRLARAEDAAALADFLGRLSPKTVRARYLGPIRLDSPTLERELGRLLHADAATHTVLLAEEGGVIRGLGEYVVADRRCADLALVVEDGYQGYGIGRTLLLNLEYRAVQQGLSAFVGEIATDNVRVLQLLRSSGRPLRLLPGYASTHFELLLESGPGVRPISLLHAMRLSPPAAA
jgi:GNAT superfamily N-acetyltransferase